MALSFAGRTRILKGLTTTLCKPCIPIQFMRGKKTAGELKKGDYITHKDKIYEIVTAAHQKVAMRGGFMIIEGKNIVDGSKLEEKFRSDLGVEEVSVFINRYNYDGRAEDGSEYFFVSQEDSNKEHAFDRNTLDKLNPHVFDYLEYFDESQHFQIKELEDKVISIETPAKVNIKIKQTGPATKGASVNQKDKPATLDNGRVVKVPFYCEPGDMVTIRLPDEAFVTRIN